jgi:hypothetical protein
MAWPLQQPHARVFPNSNDDSSEKLTTFLITTRSHVSEVENTT